MENQRHPIIGNHYFAQASSECQLTFEHGCYFACIALCQSVAEAYARFMYENWTGNSPAETLEEYIDLVRKKLTTLDFDMKRLALDMLNIKVWLDNSSVEITGTIPVEDADVVTKSS
jgi:hypothetical protein